MITKDEYQDLLDETYPAYVFAGYHYPAGKVIRSCDPIYFDVLYNDHLQWLEKEEA